MCVIRNSYSCYVVMNACKWVLLKPRGCSYINVCKRYWTKWMECLKSLWIWLCTILYIWRILYSDVNESAVMNYICKLLLWCYNFINVFFYYYSDIKNMINSYIHNLLSFQVTNISNVMQKCYCYVNSCLKDSLCCWLIGAIYE